MDKRIVVPEGMLSAADAEQIASISIKTTERILVAALQWLSDNPIVPTQEQMKACEVGWRDAGGNRQGAFFDYVLMEWQRRMFLAPEPEPSPLERISAIFEKRMTALGMTEKEKDKTVADFAAFVDSKVRASRAPEPVVPEEVKDLLEKESSTGIDYAFETRISSYNAAIIEAFNRGKRRKA